MPIDLIIQLLSGAVGGNAVGAAVKNINLGWIWNSVAGIVGGGLAGQVLAPLLGLSTAVAQTGLDPMAILPSVISGGAGGGVLMALAGVASRMMSKS